MDIRTIPPPIEGHTCTILESAVDYVIQGVLGVLAFSTLLAKWRMEAKGSGTRRPFRVFMLDTTKQSAGFFVAHVGNMVVASLLAEDDVSPCVWYFVNILFDTTVRVLLAYLMLRLIVWIIVTANLDPKGLMDFGDYGDLYVLTCGSLKRWFLQLCLWVGIVSITVAMKGFIVWMFESSLADFGNWVMGPLEDHTKEHGHNLELVIVMMVIPFVLCAMQLWIQDSFLQSRKRGQGLHRFSPQDISLAERNMKGTAASPEPIFLISDALWGPDSHRQHMMPLADQPPIEDIDISHTPLGLQLPSTPSDQPTVQEMQAIESDQDEI